MAAMAMVTGSAGVVVEVVEEAKERREGGRRIVRDECSQVKRHLSHYCGFEKSSFDLSY